jgi:hypothetical protein
MRYLQATITSNAMNLKELLPDNVDTPNPEPAQTGLVEEDVIEASSASHPAASNPDGATAHAG